MKLNSRPLLAALGLTAIIVGACSGGSSPTPAPASQAPASQAPASEAPAASATPAAEKPCKVGFSVWDMQYEFFQAMEKGTREAAEKAGCTFVLHDEKSDVNEMVTGATALLDEVDVLIISPFKPDALGPIVSAAKAKGIRSLSTTSAAGALPTMPS